MEKNDETAAADLAGIALLQDLDTAGRVRLAQRCAWRRLTHGETLCARDDEGREVFFLVEGRLQVADHAASGREVAYAVIEAGGHVGELSAIDGLPRSATVTALGSCRVAALSSAAFDELIAAHPAIALLLLRRLARVIRESDIKITELSTVGAMQRVHRELLRLATGPDGAEGPSARVIRDLPTQETLAARLGTTRETVARVLAQLVRAKITRRSGRTLFIEDPARLEALADPEGAGL